jgi:3',5'-cyclic AMP phosphodiesterase CpdA
VIVAQITDLHVMAPGKLAYGRVDTAPMLDAAIGHLNQLAPQPDLVLITGDLADHGDPAAYRHLRELLAPLKAPYCVIPGNHDRHEAFRHAFADHAYLPQQGPFIQYVIDDHPLRIVAVDSCIPGMTRGRLDGERLDWLDRTLAAQPTKPTLVIMHHAPLRTGLKHYDEVALEDPEPLEAVIRRHQQVERILCGHVHRAIQQRFGGTILSTCPSTAHQVALDLRRGVEEGFTLEPPGFQIHRWNGSALFTYTLAVGNFAGPFPFK